MGISLKLIVAIDSSLRSEKKFDWWESFLERYIKKSIAEIGSGEDPLAFKSAI